MFEKIENSTDSISTLNEHMVDGMFIKAESIIQKQ